MIIFQSITFHRGFLLYNHIMLKYKIGGLFLLVMSGLSIFPLLTVVQWWSRTPLLTILVIITAIAFGGLGIYLYSAKEPSRIRNLGKGLLILNIPIIIISIMADKYGSGFESMGIVAGGFIAVLLLTIFGSRCISAGKNSAAQGSDGP
jgi:FtsH-binding integral membrane protein